MSYSSIIIDKTPPTIELANLAGYQSEKRIIHLQNNADFHLEIVIDDISGIS